MDRYALKGFEGEWIKELVPIVNGNLRRKEYTKLNAF